MCPACRALHLGNSLQQKRSLQDDAGGTASTAKHELRGIDQDTIARIMLPTRRALILPASSTVRRVLQHSVHTFVRRPSVILAIASARRRLRVDF